MTWRFDQSADPDQFRRLLDEQNEWPAPYTFKFIVPSRGLDDLAALLEGFNLETRTSRKGNYISVTLTPLMPSSEAVIDIYERVSGIEGLVAL